MEWSTSHRSQSISMCKSWTTGLMISQMWAQIKKTPCCHIGPLNKTPKPQLCSVSGKLSSNKASLTTHYTTLVLPGSHGNWQKTKDMTGSEWAETLIWKYSARVQLYRSMKTKGEKKKTQKCQDSRWSRSGAGAKEKTISRTLNQDKLRPLEFWLCIEVACIKKISSKWSATLLKVLTCVYTRNRGSPRLCLYGLAEKVSHCASICFKNFSPFITYQVFEHWYNKRKFTLSV